MNDVITIIPARMGSTRLYGKPLAEIAGEPMILHVWRRAVAAGLGDVVVATDAVEIHKVVLDAGGVAVLTDTNHSSGTDRIHEALKLIDSECRYQYVLNVQGDLPTISSEYLVSVLSILKNNTYVEIATLCSEVRTKEEASDVNVVKVIGVSLGPNQLRAIYFTRSLAPYGDGPLFHHIGVYGFRRASLERFVGMPQSALEKREKLEQLRAIEARMEIVLEVVDEAPLSVDCMSDLCAVRRIFAGASRT